MEQDFSQVFCGTPLSDSSLPADQSLHLDTSLEILYSLGEYNNNFSKPLELSELFPTIVATPLTSDILYSSSSCALAQSNTMMFDNDDEIGRIFDSNDTFHSLGTNDLLSSLEDYPLLQTPACEPVMSSVAPQNAPLLQACKMEDTSDPTLSELNATISFDDIESVIYNDLHTDVKPVLPPLAVLPESLTAPTSASHLLASKPSPCLQQLLSVGSTLDCDSTISPTATFSTNALRLSSIDELTLHVSPVKQALPGPFASSQPSPPAKRAKISDAAVTDKPTPVNRRRTVSGSSSTSSEGRQGHGDSAYFWQYNTQAKGPKGQRLCKGLASDDPHKIVTFEDPVFDPKLSQCNLRHTGKARRGDGNDISPNSYRLHQIGKELQKLNTLLDEITPEELPSAEQPKAKRAKNKYASRACRLKRKAQHEANKLKLFGLEQEHGQLLSVLTDMKQALRHALVSGTQSDESLAVTFDRLVKQHLSVMIAGYTSQYVSTVLERVSQGDRTGGIHAH